MKKFISIAVAFALVFTMSMPALAFADDSAGGGGGAYEFTPSFTPMVPTAGGPSVGGGAGVSADPGGLAMTAAANTPKIQIKPAINSVKPMDQYKFVWYVYDIQTDTVRTSTMDTRDASTGTTLSGQDLVRNATFDDGSAGSWVVGDQIQYVDVYFWTGTHYILLGSVEYDAFAHRSNIATIVDDGTTNEVGVIQTMNGGTANFWYGGFNIPNPEYTEIQVQKVWLNYDGSTMATQPADFPYDVNFDIVGSGDQKTSVPSGFSWVMSTDYGAASDDTFNITEKVLNAAKNSDWFFDSIVVTVKDSNGVVGTPITITADEFYKVVKPEANKTYLVTFYNKLPEPITPKGGASFTKLAGNDYDTAPVAGDQEFAFQLWHYNNTTKAIGAEVPNPLDTNGYYYTDASGVVATGNDQLTDAGWYIFTEVPDSNWQIDPAYKNGIPFEMKAEGASLVAYWPGNVTEEFEVLNTPVNGSLDVNVNVTRDKDVVEWWNIYTQDFWDVYTQDYWDVFKQDYWDVYTQDFWDVYTQDYWDVYSQDYQDVYSQDYWDVYSQDFWDVYTQDYWDVFKQDFWDVYSQDFWDVYSQDYQDIYSQDFWDVYSQDYQDVYSQDFWDVYSQDFWDVYSQDFWNVYSQDFWDVYTQDFLNVYSQDFWNVYKKDFWDVYRPVFEKKINSVNDTLVSGITYGYGADGKSAMPQAGGYLGNGMTFLKINDIAQYTSENPLKVWIADSSQNSNGKKGPTEYNKNTAYSYNLYVDNGKVFVGFDDRYVSSSFGILVSDTAFNGNPTSKIKHDNNPKGTAVAADKNGNTYVFFHAENVKWYATADYAFTGWERIDTKYADPEFVEKQYADPQFVETQYADPSFVDTVKGDPQLVGTEKADPVKVGTEKAEPVKVGTDENITATINDSSYSDTFTVTIEGPSGTLNETVANIGSVSFSDLLAGDYTVTLSGTDIDFASETVTVPAGGSASTSFSGKTLTKGEADKTQLADVINPGDKLADVINPGDKLADVINPGTQLEDVINPGTQLEDVINPGTKLPDEYLGTTDPNNADSITYGKYTPPRS